MAKFDLTSRMTKYLDRHLVAPLLEFLWAKKVRERTFDLYDHRAQSVRFVVRQVQRRTRARESFTRSLRQLEHDFYNRVLSFQIYNENEILQVKLDILNKTNMMDYVIEIYKQLNPDKEVPEVSVVADRSWCQFSFSVTNGFFFFFRK